MRKAVRVMLAVVVIGLAFWAGDMTGSTTPGARWGCMPAPLPLGLGHTIVGYWADVYCEA